MSVPGAKVVDPTEREPGGDIWAYGVRVIMGPLGIPGVTSCLLNP